MELRYNDVRVLNISNKQDSFLPPNILRTQYINRTVNNYSQTYTHTLQLQTQQTCDNHDYLLAGWVPRPVNHILGGTSDKYIHKKQ